MTLQVSLDILNMDGLSKFCCDDNVINEGFIQIDDYGHWEGCKKAVKEFEASRNTCFKIFPIDGTGVWFKKPEL